jgi:tetratricopeptide (TPR) repeat protein
LPADFRLLPGPASAIVPATGLSVKGVLTCLPDQRDPPVELFISYSHRDEKLRRQLESHLTQLRRDEVIADWHDRRITPGQEWGKEIDEHLESARVILLLVSADFLASDYCYDIEVRRAMQRHEAGEAVVVPVILRPCDWNKAPFGKLQALPAEGRAVILWRPRDSAYLDVVQGIRRALNELRARQATAAEATQSTALTQPSNARPADGPASRIPREPAVGFVARRDQSGRDILTRLLEELPQGRLVALWGPGGSGKTTLAAEAARALRASYPNRLAWVSALGRTDFSLSSLLDDIITQLAPAVPRPPTPEGKEALVRSLAAESPMLVVLDNLETVTPPEEQSRCLDFLSGCPDCPALVTTRLRVKRDDVTNVRLAAMERDEAREFLRRLIDNSGRPSAFDGQDRDELIAACEANPLVLQWAAGQIVEARRADDVLEDIRRGRGDAAQRFFDRSFDLPYLGEDGRATLLALALFAPHASREALAHVAGFGEDVPRLEAAAGRLSSLWLAEATAGNERLLLRGLTRELARTHLDARPDALDFRRRFIACFLDYAVSHTAKTAKDFDALEAERDNLLGALDAAFALEDWRSVMVTRAALEVYMDVRGYWDEASRTGEQALHAARSSQDEPAVARFAHNLAVIYLGRGEMEEAHRLYGESLKISRKLGDQSGIAITLHELGRLAQNTGKVEEARRLYDESLEIEKKLGNQHGIAITLHELGRLAQNTGKVEEARRLYDESLEIEKKLGNQHGIARTMHQLGRLAQDTGEVEEARCLYDESLEIKKRLGDQSGIANTLHELGRLAQNTGEVEEARRLYDESLEIKKRLGDQSGIANTLHQLAMLESQTGNLDEARRLYDESLEINKKLGNQSGIAKTLHELGRLAQNTGEMDEARQLYEESLEIEKKLGNQHGIALSYGALGILEEQEGNGEVAARLYREALGIFEKLGSPLAKVVRERLARVEGAGNETGAGG